MTSLIKHLFLVGAAGASLAGCVADGGYGYGGVDAGYGGGYGAVGAGGGYGYYDNPDYYGAGYGWYGDYWYPGTGVLVYDRGGHGRRWNGGESSYWRAHGRRPDMPRPTWHGRPGGNWTPPSAPQGHGFTPGPGRVGSSGGRHHGHH